MLLAIREEAWAELDPEYQIALNEAIDETAAWSIVEIERRDAEILEKLEEEGMNIISKDDGLDVDAFRTQVIDYAKAEFPEWVEYINKIED
jgi:TRAP-type C4-dicarboxylate transport system substrate-binding protein